MDISVKIKDLDSIIAYKKYLEKWYEEVYTQSVAIKNKLINIDWTDNNYKALCKKMIELFTNLNATLDRVGQLINYLSYEIEVFEEYIEIGN